MWSRAAGFLDLVRNMGWRYTRFRVVHALSIKLEIFHRKFPTDPPFKKFISLAEWRQNTPAFLIDEKRNLGSKARSESLSESVQAIKQGKFKFFSIQQIDLGTDYNWTTHPVTGFDFGTSAHFADLPDLSPETGDIKYVWEKARFGFLQDLLRYDYHFGEDQSEFVLDQIIDFIDRNPINRGPNYKCSQEISLRLLNWTYALYYYKDSDALTEDRFLKIMDSIYWQLHHVYTNINFSRIAVRNNHAITETLMLFLSGLLFPFIPETARWSSKGMAWFEEEVDYQIYDDGTYLQFSMNYHRVVVQLLTVAIGMAGIYGVRFRESVNLKAQKTLDFLYNCMDKPSGKLPNYGNNDGALFFKWAEDDYRVYRSQLDDLNQVLNGLRTQAADSGYWYGSEGYEVQDFEDEKLSTYPIGGYVVINEQDNSKTFFANTAYRDRPSQADNLHLDIWCGGENYLWDPGTYLYNAPIGELNNFISSQAHNTCTIEGNSHMRKAGRFIWNHWINHATLEPTETAEDYNIKAELIAYRNTGGNKISREATKVKGRKIWKINDSVQKQAGDQFQQHWQINLALKDKVELNAMDADGNILKPKIEQAWYSSYYGQKEQSLRCTFSTFTDSISTEIKIHAS